MKLLPTPNKGTGLLTDVGFVATPRMGTREIFGRVGAGVSGSPDGIRILFGEGIYDFPLEGVTINSQKVELVSLSPGKTIFRRTSAKGTPTGPMIVAADRYFYCDGITFSDQVTTTYPCIRVDGAGSNIRNCTFASCWRAIDITAANWHRVQDNLVQTSRSTGYVIILSGTSARCLVSGNQLWSSTVDTGIYAGDGVSYSSFVGNVGGKTGAAHWVVSYLDNAYNEDVGNIGITELRAAGGAVLSG